MKSKKKRSGRLIQEKSSLTVLLAFKKASITIRKSEKYKEISMEQGVSIGKPGQPALPSKKIHISIPWDSEGLEIDAIHTKTTLLAKDIIISPCQPIVPIEGKEAPIWVKPDERLYSSSTTWPLNVVKINGVIRNSGFAIANMDVCPFVYYFKEKKLYLIENIEIIISYKRTGKEYEAQLTLTEARYVDKLQLKLMNLVVNPEAVLANKYYTGDFTLKDYTWYPKVDYVIITSNALDTEFQRLAKWRTQFGLNARVVTVEDIKSNSVKDTGGKIFWKSAGYTDGGTRDLAEAVRNFVKWVNKNWLTEYVIIGGDTEIVPCRYAIHTAADPADDIKSGGVGIFRYLDLDAPDPDENRPFAYQITEKITRANLKNDKNRIKQNPTNSLDGDLIIIACGQYAGTIVPYMESSDENILGWCYVTNLVEENGSTVEVSTVPTNYIEIRGPNKYHGQTFITKIDKNYIATDFYYSDVSLSEYEADGHHDWDEDDNGIYGERYSDLDKVIGTLDVHVGRIPARLPEQAKSFIDKLMRYEMFEDEEGFQLSKDFAVSIFLGSRNWYTDEVNVLDRSAQGKEDIRHDLISYDSTPLRWIFTRRYEDYDDVPQQDIDIDLEGASAIKMKEGLEAGHNVISLTSHGGADGMCYLKSQDVEEISSRSGIFYANACYTNRFDLNPQDAEAYNGRCFSECAILNPNGAAVAYVGSTRMGSTGDNPLEREFWFQMPRASVLGEMFKSTLEKWDMGWHRYSLNLLGDPAMRVWSDRPIQLTITHPDQIETGTSTVNVYVTCNGAPVENATVCLTMEGIVFVTRQTASNGKTACSVTTQTPGVMRITVSGKNMIPYRGSINVKQAKTSPGCNKEIVCTVSLNCKNKLVCKNFLVATCNASLSVCTAKLLNACPSVSYGCPTVDPFKGKIDWEDLLRATENIYEIWGFRDVNEFAKYSKTQHVKDTLKALPKEIRKPIRFLLQKIKEEYSD